MQLAYIRDFWDDECEVPANYIEQRPDGMFEAFYANWRATEGEIMDTSCGVFSTLAEAKRYLRAFAFMQEWHPNLFCSDTLTN